MFKLQGIPIKIEVLIKELEFLFNTYQLIHFKCLLLYLLLTPYKATISGMSKVISFGTHRSKHNEFLIDCTKILSLALRRYSMILLQILYKEKEPVYLTFDDYSNKRRGKHISVAFKFFDYLSKTYMLGHQVVCAIIEYRGFVIPYAAEIYVPKDQTSFFNKKTKIAEDMIKTFDIDYHLKEQVFVLGDCFYATAPIINHCRRNGYILISSLKNNRVVTIDNQTGNIGDFIKNNFKKGPIKSLLNLRVESIYITIEKPF